MRYKLFTLFIFFISILGLVNFVFTEQSINEQLQNAQDTIVLMQNFGLTTNRVEDLYFVANSLYLQAIDENRTDFSDVISKLNELKIISGQAFNVFDEFRLFETELDDAKESIDIKQIMPIYDDAKKELKDERYSIALDKLTEARQKIAELKSFGAKTRAISSQLSKGLISFLNVIKYWIIGIFSFLLVIYLLFRKKINRYFLSRKYKKYEKQKTVLQNLIKRLQSDYFMGNNVSETSYKVKLKKYDDLITNINRDMAIIKEELLE